VLFPFSILEKWKNRKFRIYWNFIYFSNNVIKSLHSVYVKTGVTNSWFRKETRPPRIIKAEELLTVWRVTPSPVTCPSTFLRPYSCLQVIIVEDDVVRFGWSQKWEARWKCCRCDPVRGTLYNCKQNLKSKIWNRISNIGIFLNPSVALDSKFWSGLAHG